MSSYLKPMLKHALVTALALSLVLTFVSPLLAGAMSVDVTTAKSNETGTGKRSSVMASRSHPCVSSFPRAPRLPMTRRSS